MDVVARQQEIVDENTREILAAQEFGADAGDRLWLQPGETDGDMEARFEQTRARLHAEMQQLKFDHASPRELREYARRSGRHMSDVDLRRAISRRPDARHLGSILRLLRARPAAPESRQMGEPQSQGARRADTDSGGGDGDPPPGSDEPPSTSDARDAQAPEVAS